MNREEIYAKYGGKCAYCGQDIALKQMQVDHIIPKRRWGYGVYLDKPSYDVNDIQNLNPACAVCNRWKTVYFLEEFRREMEAQVERAKISSRNYRMALRYGLVKPTGAKVVFWFERMPTHLKRRYSSLAEEEG